MPLPEHDAWDHLIPTRLTPMYGLKSATAALDVALKVLYGVDDAFQRFQIGDTHAKQLFARVTGLLL